MQLVRLKENIKSERMPRCDSFNPFYLWQYRKAYLRYAIVACNGCKNENTLYHRDAVFDYDKYGRICSDGN